jgi:rRNA-processing protein FCF1
MYYSRDQHKRFLDKELTAISETYLKLLNSKALSLLSTNDVYVTQFTKLDLKESVSNDSDRNVLGSGQLILKFKKDKGIPRKNEYFTAVILDGDLCLPKNWGNISWGKLRSHQIEFSEVHCVWQGKTDEKGFLLCGFSGVSLEMVKYLDGKEGCVIVLGPQEPPIDYYQNLIGIVSNSQGMPADMVLDFDKKDLKWMPSDINSNKEQVPILIEQLSTTDQVIFQGPPGTGKTYLVAELVANLLSQNKSVLVTAMTNRALIELAGKDSLKEFLSQKKVMKTNVSSDEMIACKNLVPIDSKEISCISGKLTLSTFYNTSGWAKLCYKERPFDYVIMDEASQALLGMIAACMNLGTKQIWIGDQNQMQPIVLLSDETIVRNNYQMLSNGFQTLCDNFDYKSYILTETHRLLPSAAALTSIFYNTQLKSVTDFSYELTDVTEDYIPEHGGTSMIFKEMPVGEKADYDSCQSAINVIDSILHKHPKIRIAILAKFRATVRMLQNCFIGKYGSMNNVLIDTVERIQGMTCDVCLYFIPNTMMKMSLDRPLFNVATSRAKQLTLIYADKNILSSVCDKDVHNYIETIIGNPIALKKKSEEIHTIQGKGINISIRGKIDLSKFETPKQKAVKSISKKNIYIIDTNVFVDCPEIISKIGNEYQIVLSAKVIDELDKLKITLDPTGKRSVETALRSINRALDKSNVSMELSNMELLPNDFSKKSPDNNILTVALKFKEENPILITSDNGLQVKAKGLNIKTISLRDFIKR